MVAVREYNFLIPWSTLPKVPNTNQKNSVYHYSIQVYDKLYISDQVLRMHENSKSKINLRTRLTYNCAHLRSTKESLTDSAKNLFVRKKFCVKTFLGENLLGEHFLSEHFFWGEIFWVKFFLVKIMGEIFVGDIFLGEHFFE